jgi:hypothetical protein
MVPDNLTIVCYAGGSCGDLITAMIDPQDINQVKNSYLYIKGISGGEFSTATDI